MTANATPPERIGSPPLRHRVFRAPQLWPRAAAIVLGLALPLSAPGQQPLSPTRPNQAPADNPALKRPGSGQQKPTKQLLRGRVVYLAEAMERRWGVKSVREAAERTLALECRDGRLIPLVEDVRGRAFRADARLRALPDLELLVRRDAGWPAAQIIRLYAYEQGQRVELDYWCEICAIAMFELKACDCCQGPIELRRRPAPSR